MPTRSSVEGGLDTSIGSTEPEPRLSREDIFEILSNRRRRYVLHYIKQFDSGDGEASLAELASQVAAWENGVDVREVNYEDRKSVQTSLYQLHLPKLAEKGLIEYDKRAGAIRGTDHIDKMEVYLETVPDREISWPTFFVGVSATAVVLSVGVLTDAVLISALPDAVWFLFSALVFLSVSIWFAYDYQYKMRFGSGGRPPECDT